MILEIAILVWTDIDLAVSELVYLMSDLLGDLFNHTTNNRLSMEWASHKDLCVIHGYCMRQVFNSSDVRCISMLLHHALTFSYVDCFVQLFGGALI